MLFKTKISHRQASRLTGAADMLRAVPAAQEPEGTRSGQGRLTLAL